jgi:hypothetical protein
MMGGEYLRRKGLINACPEAGNYNNVDEIFSEENIFVTNNMFCFLQSYSTTYTSGITNSLKLHLQCCA